MTAVAWLLDVLPPEFREHSVLRRYPAALAHMARHHARGGTEGARQGYRTARTYRLAAAERGAQLVEHALRRQAPAPTRGAHQLFRCLWAGSEFTDRLFRK